jgi:hypothetical protein
VACWFFLRKEEVQFGIVVPAARVSLLITVFADSATKPHQFPTQLTGSHPQNIGIVSTRHDILLGQASTVLSFDPEPWLNGSSFDGAQL